MKLDLDWLHSRGTNELVAFLKVCESHALERLRAAARCSEDANVRQAEATIAANEQLRDTIEISIKQARTHDDETD